ncbi:MAG TPA: SDR family NAD(P)-dependent oxidoreductase [Acidothermaceae bacterium]|jgi:NAD(P)-dependent dehydrogenase (short-subunit alcohol dehydrogenase family)
MALLDDVVVVISGAGRGIGHGEAIELASHGARVVVNDVDAEVAAAVVAEIAEAGGIASAHVGDCSGVEAAQSLVHQAIHVFGRLDAVVNNAGIVRDRTLAKMSAEEWDAVIAVHLRGHYALTHAACAHWKERGGPGRIVCTSSTSGLLGNFGQANYGAAKAGIAAFSTIVAQEMARYGVTCNAIAPAARTRMTEGAYGEIGDAVPEGTIPADTISGDTAEFDFWHPDNVAPMVAFLCSPASAHISGKVFGVQGDTVEIYRPWTSAAVIENGKRRWDVDQLGDRVMELFIDSGVASGPENAMARLRYSMTDRTPPPHS